MDFKEESYIFYLRIKLSDFKLCNYFSKAQKVTLLERTGIHKVATKLFLCYHKLIFTVTIGDFCNLQRKKSRFRESK